MARDTRCWVYVLRGSDGKNYTGIAVNLGRRIKEHNAGKTPADAKRGPFELIYKERCSNTAAARERERFLKSGVGREWLKAILREGSGSALPPRSEPAEGG